jgi:hypothetical protein
MHTALRTSSIKYAIPALCLIVAAQQATALTVDYDTGTSTIIDNTIPSGWDGSLTLRVGRYASNGNALTLTGSGTQVGVITGGSLALGGYSGSNISSDNSVRITNGAGLKVRTAKVGNLGATVNNSLTLSSGGTLDCERLYVGNINFMTGNTALVSGSVLTISTHLYIGTADSSNFGNTLTLADSSLAVLGSSDYAYAILSATGSNHLVFDGGYLAIYTGTLTESDQLIDQFQTIVASGNVKVGDTVVTQLSAFSFTAGTSTSYSGVDLTGYTLISAVPEPSTTAAIAGILALAATRLRRKRRA